MANIFVGYFINYPIVYIKLCGAPTGFQHTWTSIEGHECGRYKEEVDKAADSAQQALKRYMFYFERLAKICTIGVIYQV